jgi:hypothetical protein
VYRADETSLIPDHELEAARREMSEQQYAQEFLCSFTTSTGNTLIPITLAVEASKRKKLDIEVKGGVKVLGVDVARYGDDRSVIFPVIGLKAYEPIVMQGVDNVELARRLIAKIDDFEPHYVRIDAGRGEGVIDYLRSHRYKCTEVNFGAAPLSAYYQNARAEMWHGLKKWLEAGGSIPEIPELISELASPEYSFSSANKMVLETKEKMKDRGLRSPDYADALALAVGYPLRANDATNVVKNTSAGLTTRRHMENPTRRLRR